MDDALAFELDHAFMSHFDHALKVAHAFVTKLTMHLSLIILSALEFHTLVCHKAKQLVTTESVIKLQDYLQLEKCLE